MSDAMEGLLTGLIGGIQGGAGAMADIYKDERQNAAKVENETQLAEERSRIEEERAKRIEEWKYQKETERAPERLRQATETSKAEAQARIDVEKSSPDFKSKAAEQKAKNEWTNKYEAVTPGSPEEKALHRSGVIRGWIKPEPQETETVTSIERNEAGEETGRVVSKRPAGTAPQKPKEGRRGIEEILGGKKEAVGKEIPPPEPPRAAQLPQMDIKQVNQELMKMGEPKMGWSKEEYNKYNQLIAMQKSQMGKK